LFTFLQEERDVIGRVGRIRTANQKRKTADLLAALLRSPPKTKTSFNFMAKKKDADWADEGLEDLNRRLPEDTVEYFAYLLDPKPNKQDQGSSIDGFRSAAEATTKSLLGDYIWQNEEFKLHIDDEKSMLSMNNVDLELT
jgi:hypothetical protein